MQYFIVDEYATEDNKGVYDSESSESISSVSLPHHQASQTIEKDLIMVKILIFYRYHLVTIVFLSINLAFPSFALGSHASPCLCF